MKKNPTSIDGFIPRNRATQAPKNVNQTSKKPVANLAKTPTKATRQTPSKTTTMTAKAKTRSDDLDGILFDLDVRDPNQDERKGQRQVKKLSKKEQKLAKKLQKYNKKRQKKGKRPVSINQFVNRRRWKRGLIVLGVAVLVGGGYIAYKAADNIGRVFGGNILDLIKKEKLAEDSLGRTNVLIFGTSPDGWDGQDLTDSIMVASLNQETGDAYTVSLPRDLWVKHTCASWLGTTAGKLNESYGCGKKDAEAAGQSAADAELAGQKELAKAATEVLGLEIHYQVHANWQVLVDSINALGGIDVTIEVYDGSPEMYDVATNIRYRDGEVAHMDGETALAFTRARGAFGGYGLSGGNFDRERNQQKVLQAAIDKAKQSGKNNLVAIMGLLDAVGENVNTSFEQSEIQTIARLSGSFEPSNITSIPLVDPENDVILLNNGNVGGASIVQPTAGLYQYDKIKAHIAKITNQDPVVKEEAKIVVLNGTEITGLAAEQAGKLAEDGFDVVEYASAPTLDYKKTIIYTFNENKPLTTQKLAEKLNATVAGAAPNALANYSQADIVVIMGED